MRLTSRRFSSVRLPAADLALLGFLALVPLLLWLPFLAGGKAIYYRDAMLVYQPDAAFISRSLARGELPFWNPLVAGGYPQLASLEPALYYPGLLFFMLMPFAAALPAAMLVHQLAAAWAMYALGRQWAWARIAAAAAALVYAGSGYLATSANIYPLVPRAAWFPLLVLAFERAIRGGRRESLLLLAVWALASSQTRPDTTMIEFLILACLAIVRTQAKGGPAGSRAWRPLAILLAGQAGALLLNTGSLLPGVEFLANSNRSGGIGLGESQTFSYAPADLLTVFVPGVFGDPQWGTDWGKYLIGEPTIRYTSYFLSLYMGWAPWLLIPYAWQSRRPDARWQLALAAGAGLLALGRHAPFFAWMVQLLPPTRLMRYPVKFWFIVTWCLAAITGHGLDELIRRPTGHRRPVFALAAAAGVASLTATAWLWPQTWLAALAAIDYRALATGPVAFDVQRYVELMLPQVFPDVRACLTMAAAICCGYALALLSPRTRMMLPGLIAIDLVGHAMALNFAAPADFYARVPPVAAQMKQSAGAEPFRFFKPLGQTGRIAAPGPAPAPGPPGLPYQLAYAEALRDRLGGQIAEAYDIAGVYRGVSLSPYFSSPYLLDNLDALYQGAPPAARLATVAGMLNVRFLLVPYAPALVAPTLPARLASPALPLSWQDRQAGLWLLENRLVLPRAFWVPAAVTVPDLATATRVLCTELDPAREAVLEAPEPGAALADPRPAVGKADVQLLMYGNDDVKIALHSPRAGYLVLTDNHYPGWRAYLDDHPIKLLRADVVARAVQVPAGNHIVEFCYLPWSILAGELFALAAWALLLAGLARGWARA